ncbi:MAG: AI-2E family transporter [Candidatus Zixiibacteriota bacterium]
MKESRPYITLQTIALPFITLAAATAFFYFASPIVIPILIAISLAYVLSPAVWFFEKLKFPRVLSVIVVLLITLIVVGWVGYFLSAQVSDLFIELPQYWEGFLYLLSELKTDLIERGIIADTGELDLQEFQLKDFSGVTGYMVKGLTSVVTFVFGTVLIVFLTFFMLSDQRIIKRKLVTAFGKSEMGVAENIISKINEQIRNYLLTKFLVSAALGVVLTIWFLIIGVNYAYIWGPLAGMLNLVPYIGPFIGLFPPLIVSAIQFKAIMPVVWVLIAYVGTQSIEGNYITPRLIGERVNLSPLAVLAAVMYWTWLWGAIGIILAIPITAAIKIICDHIDSLRPIGVILGGKRDLQKEL